MATHPLWSPFSVPTDAEIAAARLLPHTPEAVEVVAPDPGWPVAFAAVRRVVTTALGERALSIAHVGSTSVPGLWAKPLIDIDLVVADSADEPAWLPDLERAGFVLRGREPEWQEHRILRLGADEVAPLAAGASVEGVNLHVWSPDGAETARHAAFRDWLRTHPEDRDAYAAHKREVAARGFSDSMQYNNAKAAFVYDLYERIFAADPEHAHDPQPRAEGPVR